MGEPRAKPGDPAKHHGPRAPAALGRPIACDVDHEVVLASLLVGVLTFSVDGQVTYVNSAAEALLGHSGRDMVGRAVADVLGSAPWLADLAVRAASATGASLRGEGTLGQDVKTQVVSVASMLCDRAGARTGTIVALHDLGRRRLLESDEEARSRLEEIDRMISSAAHELNNPLSGIRGAGQLLAKKVAADGELANYATMIVRQSDRMAELIRGLMKLETPPPALEPVNIHRVLNEVLLVQRPAADARGIQLVSEFDPSLPEVYGHEDQLQQLFLNVVGNAVRAAPSETGRVRVSTRMEHAFYVETGTRRLRYIAVDVIDNGPGFDEETRRLLFTPFFSRSTGGHGLGLSIARNIAVSHGGRILAESLDSGGARFRVNLPVHETPVGSARG